ncbi:GTP-binding protein [Cohnella algarum]|uniref:GTP-binding protein n=1 Tax=Cohnella algarum TaxID=2044859 RepID=UPI003B833E84
MNTLRFTRIISNILWDRGRIETILSELPSSIYRAKGIFTAADTGERMMFQVAYRQLNLFRIKPQSNVQDVAVFMGEQFPKQEIKRKLEEDAGVGGV